MSVGQMRAYLLKWNPRWKESTVKRWSDRQVLAIYTKELEKQPKKNSQYKQLSFF